MTDKEFQYEVDRIYFRYCPFLLIGAKYDVKVDLFTEHLNRMKVEVMALKGVPDELKAKAGEDIKRRIIEFVVNHNKQTDAGK